MVKKSLSEPKFPLFNDRAHAVGRHYRHLRLFYLNVDYFINLAKEMGDYFIKYLNFFFFHHPHF